MGLLFSRFRRSPKSSKVILEDLEQKIQYQTQRIKRDQQYERSCVGYLLKVLILSFFAYIIGVIIFYFYFFPETWVEVILYALPLLLFPLVVYFVKKLLNICFTQRKTKFDLQLRTLHEEKRKTLNEVMEKETYRTARELLERFDPNHPSLQATPARQRSNNHTPARRDGTELHQRRQQPQTPHPAFMQRNIAVATPRVASQPPPMATPRVAGQLPPMATPRVAGQLPPMATPRVAGQPTPMATPRVAGQPPPMATPSQVQPPQTSTAPQNPRGVSQPAPPSATSTAPQQRTTDLQYIPPGMCLGVAPGPPVPSPILPRDRTNVDKLVEFIVGDGPNNRYALICQQCYSHNGMALRDEFEYLTFRCAYCYHVNQARKKKPTLTETVSTASLSGKQSPEESDTQGADQNDGSNEATDQPLRDEVWTHMPPLGSDRRHTHSSSDETTTQRHHSKGQRSHSQSSEM